MNPICILEWSSIIYRERYSVISVSQSLKKVSRKHAAEKNRSFTISLPPRYVSFIPSSSPFFSLFFLFLLVHPPNAELCVCVRVPMVGNFFFLRSAHSREFFFRAQYSRSILVVFDFGGLPG